MDYVDLLLRWIHILSAIVLVGGAFFWKLVWQPAAAELDEKVRDQTFEAMRKRWSMIVHIGITLLLITGLINAVRIIQQYSFTEAPYHILVAVKLVLALLLAYLAMRLAGRSEGAKRFRASGTWSTINVVLAVIVVCFAGYMKSVPREPKLGADIVPQTAAASTSLPRSTTP